MSRRRPAPNANPEQERLLAEAKQMCNVQAFQMKRSLDQSPPDLMEALKNASNMIAELRTGLLSPRAYEELYRLCFDHLRHLEAFLQDSKNKGYTLLELYELVQYAGNILPRLYLLITVGSVYIRSMEAPANDVIYDLVELCRGVQHPTRGLFLRNYLSVMTKDLMPDDGSPYSGNVTDSIDFIIANFTEMNKLWVRMQHGAGPVRSPAQRRTERQELSLLIGKNLQRLSQLDGLTLGLYRSDVLPRILSQVTQCRDTIAQQYLMDILIQVFSDDFHLRTLDTLLAAFLSLQDDVDIFSIVATLIDRLAKYCEENRSAIPTDVDMFSRFTEYTDKLAAEASKTDLSAIIGLEQALIFLALRVYNGTAGKLDAVYASAKTHIERRGYSNDPSQKKVELKAVFELLHAPLTYFNDVRRVLTLPSYGEVVQLLPYDSHKRFSLQLIDSILSTESTIPTTEEVDALFSNISPLIKDHDEQGEFDAEDWEDDQTRVAYAINMLQTDDVEAMFGILVTASSHLSTGGPERMKYTLPSIVFKALALVQSLFDKRAEDANWEKKAKKIFKFANDAVGSLKTAGKLHLAFRLYLDCSLAAGHVQLKNFAYGFLTKGAITIYEEDAMGESATQFEAIRLLISTVQRLNCFDQESYTFLVTRLVQHASKLLNFDDQSRALAQSAHLFISLLDGGKNNFLDDSKILAVLKKAMTVAGKIHESEVMVQVLVDLLDHFVLFHKKLPEKLGVAYVNAIIKKIHKHFTVSALANTNPVVLQFAAIKSYIELEGVEGVEF